MDEQEVPEDSSKEISNNKSSTSDDIVSASSGDDTPNSEAGEKLDTEGSTSPPGEGETGIPITPEKLTPEELPTMQWSDVYSELAEFENVAAGSDQEHPLSPADQQQPAETGPLEGLEEAMDWLEELAAGQGMPIDEMPTLATAQPVPDRPTQSGGDSKASSGDRPAVQGLELDSDPMAWLEQLAVDQSSPLEELPSVADRLLASEIVSLNEIPPSSTINDPYDVNQALTYLEQLAVAQGIDLTKVSFDADQPVNSLKSALTIIDGLALTGMALTVDASEQEAIVEEKGMVPTVGENGEPEEVPEPDHWADVSTSMPDDPQQALDWLSNIDEDHDAVEMEVVVEADTTAPKEEIPDPDSSENHTAVEKGEGGAQIDVDVLDEMPEDPDEAVAWMEDLAARDSQNPAAEGEIPISQEDPDPIPEPEPSSQSLESLESAQTASVEDNLQKTIALYQGILSDDAGTEEVVAALEEAIDSYGESPKILKLLGDAYMQIGETEKAVEVYRKGFDHF